MKRVVIIGAGFGGLALAKKLQKSKQYQVTLLDKNNFHTFQPLLYQVATGGLEPGNIAYPVRRIFRDQSKIHFKMCEVKGVDPLANKIFTTIGDIDYDIMVLAQGAKTNFFGNEQIAKHSLTLKSVTDSLDFRSNLIQNLESAINTMDDHDRSSMINVAIVGGGPAGLEMAGSVAEMRNYVLPKDYPELDFSLMRIYLFEAGNKLLSSMSAYSSKKSLEYLTSLGIEVRLNTQVKNYDGKIIELADGTQIPCQTLMWTAGVKGNDLPGMDMFSHLKGGRIEVDQFNRVNNLPNVFAIGDIALQVDDLNPKGFPMMATVAIQQGKHLGENLLRSENQKDWVPFKYFNKGAMATIGRNRAVADIAGFKFGGVFAWFLWMFVHIISLVGYRNKIVSFINWVENYINYDRPLGLIIRKYKRSKVDKAEEQTILE